MCPLLTKDEFFSTLTFLIGDKRDDESVKALEDMTDTYNALEKGVQGDGVDWKKRAEEIDASWRQKYANRFFRGESGNPPAGGGKEKDSDFYDPNTVKFGDLFSKA